MSLVVIMQKGVVKRDPLVVKFYFSARFFSNKIQKYGFPIRPIAMNNSALTKGVVFHDPLYIYTLSVSRSISQTYLMTDLSSV